MVNEIIHGDCVEVMDSWDESIIDFCMFSPPYDVGKEYEENIGKEKYIIFLTNVLTSLNRVLKSDGRFSIVVPLRDGKKKAFTVQHK